MADKPRYKLHQELVDILGSNKVYFQPPTNFKIGHPCIVYALSKIRGVHASNDLYNSMKQYQVTLIHTDPDTVLIDDILKMPFTIFETSYTSDNLNHYVYTIYHK